MHLSRVVARNRFTNLPQGIVLFGDDDGAGWTVESAPAVDGPWSPLLATPFLLDGRHTVAVPTDAKSRFFRLR